MAVWPEGMQERGVRDVPDSVLAFQSLRAMEWESWLGQSCQEGHRREGDEATNEWVVGVTEMG